MLAYRFLPETWALRALREQRLKISLIKDLNDPFELASINLRDKKLRPAFAAMKTQLSETTGLLCFSKRWTNPLLWSHYADRHKGICLGFRIPDGSLEPVGYEVGRLTLDSSWSLTSEAEKQALTKKLLLTKFKDWSYEEEYRLFLRLSELDESNGHYFCDFDGVLALSEVIVGSSSTLASEELLDALGKSIESVKIVKARMAFKSFEVVRDKRGFLAAMKRQAPPSTAGVAPQAIRT